MEYKLIIEVDSKKLTDKVNEFIGDDEWELYGQPSMAIAKSQYTTVYRYCQAVIKK